MTFSLLSLTSHSMPDSVCLNSFLQLTSPLLDVRSPNEYKQGHIPTSLSFPLFTNDERVMIGTAYKQESPDKALDLGLRLAAPKLPFLFKEASHYLPSKKGRILCWRGGIRSRFVAHLLTSLGFSITLLQGGYQTFRRRTVECLRSLHSKSPILYVLGGLTGSGKTEILNDLKQIGSQVLDLEAIARHRGSVFGRIGLTEQPSQEQFENELYYQWSQFDYSKPIWIEDESRLIGNCQIPSDLYQLMNQAPLIYLKCQTENRIQHLINLYGHNSPLDLVQATLKLSKRLGSQLTKEIVNLINQSQNKEAFKLLLSYYDKRYGHQLTKRKKIYFITKSSTDLDCAYQLKHFETNGIYY